MPIYHCDTCNYKTNIVTHYNKHLRTKKHIKLTNELVNISNTIDQNSQQHKCKYCDKVYKHKSSLCKHIKHYCKKNKDEDLLQIINKLKNKIDSLQKENAFLFEKIENYENLIDSIP